MRRIVHLASGREWRGGQRQTWLLTRELQRLGVDQVLVTARVSELARRAAADGVPVRPVAWTAGLDPRAWWAARAEARRAPAILHAHDGHAVTIARWAADAATPWLATRRNVTPLRRPAGWQDAARVVAISNAVRAQLLRDGLRAERIVVVHSAIDLEATRATPHEDLRAWARLPNGGALIVTVAAVTPEKGLDLLPLTLKGLAADHDVRWVVVGDGPLRTDLQHLAREWGLADRLFLPGHHPDPVRLLRDADLFVLPSTSEGLGTSILDALALDLPVVATRSGGVEDILQNGAGLLVPVGDAQALAQAVARMLDDAELRRRTVEAGRAAVTRFGVTAMAAAMRTVYDSVAANR
ncbi:MAG TPA: glycosyltransferase [Gemmatimonadales bacterium]|nr:glycosyltransferase [Gemmatimonadales bacterium]